MSIDGAYKIVQVGDIDAGKTSLLLRLIQDRFNKERLPTIGAAFMLHKMVVDGREVKVEVWDIAGQERFGQAFHYCYYKGASGATLVFDITNKESFEALRHRWFGELKQYTPPDVKIILVGNKSDLDDRPAVGIDAINQLCEEFGGIPYFETSAKTGEGVTEAFTALVRMLPESPPPYGNRVCETRHGKCVIN